jgi:hypothetical protein
VRVWTGFKSWALLSVVMDLLVPQLLEQLLKKRIGYKKLLSYKITQKQDDDSDNSAVVTI